jgi:hypothetical protein
MECYVLNLSADASPRLVVIRDIESDGSESNDLGYFGDITSLQKNEDCSRQYHVNHTTTMQMVIKQQSGNAFHN